jgi:hypothetical protein
LKLFLGESSATQGGTLDDWYLIHRPFDSPGDIVHVDEEPERSSHEGQKTGKIRGHPATVGPVRTRRKQLGNPSAAGEAPCQPAQIREPQKIVNLIALGFLCVLCGSLCDLCGKKSLIYPDTEKPNPDHLKTSLKLLLSCGGGDVEV